MEEGVGKLWHGLITGSASRRHAREAVHLEAMHKTLGVFFRALGGDGGLRVSAATATHHGARRSWLERIAGENRKVELAWLDGEALMLPERIDMFPSRALNRELYLWLAALAAFAPSDDTDWLNANQQGTRRTLAAVPGLGQRYRHLLEAYLALRPDLRRLREDEARQERAIRLALRHPGRIARLPDARRPPAPVHLWLHPDPPRAKPTESKAEAGGESPESGETLPGEELRRHHAERVDMPDGQSGLLLDRFENILSWAEYIKVDRTTDEDEDLENAKEAAADLDVLSLARDNQATAKRLRFDLDLPGAAGDDLPLGSGIPLPEWNHRKGLLVPNYCSLQPMISTRAEAAELPAHLQKMARRLRAQFQALAPSHIWLRAQNEGQEIDLDAYQRFVVERTEGRRSADPGLYRALRKGKRDLACLLLADLSLSTDAWVNDQARVIDVIRDSLLLFSEALSAGGDRFATYGFSSRSRHHVRFHTLKGFDEGYDARVRGRILALRPGFYTRMGAAIRHAGALLAAQQSEQRLLLLLTDGKPNDLDRYEGRYGVEDTRMALIEARRQGLRPFCVTIDERAGDYLPHMFGANGYIVIRRPAELPQELPRLYAQLTA